MYRSPFEAYPFLCDDGADLRCDFELATDRLSSAIGLLRAQVPEAELAGELLWVGEMVYHLNATLRTRLTVTPAEIDRLRARTEALSALVGARCRRFVQPQGSGRACLAHLLRVDCKSLVRLIYRYDQAGGAAPEALYDFVNLLSGYFFFLALYLNELDGVDEVDFVSRNYPAPGGD